MGYALPALEAQDSKTPSQRCLVANGCGMAGEPVEFRGEGPSDLEGGWHDDIPGIPVCWIAERAWR